MQETKRYRFNAWMGKIPWRRAWQPTPVFLPGVSHGQRSLVGCIQSIGSQRVGCDWRDLACTQELWTWSCWFGKFIIVLMYSLAFSYCCGYWCRYSYLVVVIDVRLMNVHLLWYPKMLFICIEASFIALHYNIVDESCFYHYMMIYIWLFDLLYASTIPDV